MMSKTKLGKTVDPSQNRSAAPHVDEHHIEDHSPKRQSQIFINPSETTATARNADEDPRHKLK